MKVLKGTAARIKGKLYPEGSSVPKEYEKEFEKFLVEKEIPKAQSKKDSDKESK